MLDLNCIAHVIKWFYLTNQVKFYCLVTFYCFLSFAGYFSGTCTLWCSGIWLVLTVWINPETIQVVLSWNFCQASSTVWEWFSVLASWFTPNLGLKIFQFSLDLPNSCQQFTLSASAHS